MILRGLLVQVPLVCSQSWDLLKISGMWGDESHACSAGMEDSGGQGWGGHGVTPGVRRGLRAQPLQLGVMWSGASG